MRYILAILLIFLGSGVAKAGYPYYYYYTKPDFYVAQQIIPVIVHHQNFIDNYGDKKIKKVELFAPVFVEKQTIYNYYPPHPRFRR